MRLHVTLVLLVAFAAPGANAATPAAHAARAVADMFVIPHYRALAVAADTQVRVWEAFCRSPAGGREESLRAAYQVTADRWAEIEFVKTGPIVRFLRAERFNYWPEQRNATQRNLDALLASTESNALAPATLMRDSVPAQGLPALERLLYEPSYARHPRRCVVGLGIARNLAAIARDVLREWIAPDGARAAIAADKAWNNTFASADEAGRMLLTDLVGAFTSVRDQKLLAPLGADAASAKPRAAEAWRSGRSVRNIRLNLAAAYAMEKVLAAHIGGDSQQALARSFGAAERAVNVLPDDLGRAVADLKGRTLIDFAIVALRSAQSMIITVLAPALGATLGFNALDGD